MIRKRFLKGILLAVCMGFKLCMYVSAGKHICCTGVYLWTSTSFPCSSTPIYSRIYRGKQQRFHEQSMPSPIKTFKTIITWCQLCQHFLYEQALRIQAGLAKDCKHFISLYSLNRISLKASINPNLQQLSRFFYCNPQHCEKNRPLVWNLLFLHFYTETH